MKISRILLILVLFPLFVFAQISLPPIFRDGMVLQRGKSIKVWGTTSSGKEVSVTFENKGKVINADESGAFSLLMDAPELSDEPKSMKVKCDGDSIIINDILVGDVFLLSGQSNMAWKISQLEADMMTEVKNDSNYPEIRYYMVAKNFVNGSVYGNDGIADLPWVKSDATSAPNMSAIGFYFARQLYKDKNIPIGLIDCSQGSSSGDAWISPQYIENHPELKPYLLKEVQTNAQHYSNPSILYNKMLSRVLPYNVSSVLWYQGEANAATYPNYTKVLPALIQSFRESYLDNNLPFIIIQLSAFQNTNSWPHIREIQDSVANATPFSALVSTIDVGMANNIHPTNKKPVGERCVLAIRKILYGDDINYSGPTYSSVRFDENRAIVSFKHTEGLKTVSNLNAGFEICDSTFYYQPVTNAEISNNELILSSTLINTPVAIRYAWSNFPPVNLYNNQNLPANPFRTSKQNTSVFTSKVLYLSSTDGDDTNYGQTSETAVATFSKAIDLANNSGGFVTEIVVSPGIYIESGTVATLSNSCPNLLIRGESAKTTIIQRTGEGRILNTSGSYLTSSNTLTIRDITLRDANVTNLQGAAIYFSRTGNMNSNLTLERVIFENNTITSGATTSNGGAFFFNGNQLTVTDCYFKDNKVFKSGTNNPQGGAVTIATLASTDGLFATFTNTTFEGNEAYTSGGALFFNNVGARLETSPNSYVNFVNCTFLNNKATNTGTTGGAVNLTSGANAAYHLMDYKLVNCTFLNNSSEGTNSKNTLMLNGNRYNSATMVNNLIVPLSTASTGDVFGGNFATNERLIGSNNLIGGSINTTNITSSYFRTDSLANNNLIGRREDFFINSTLTDNSTETVFAVPYLELNSGSKAINFGVNSYGDPNIVPATDVRGATIQGVSKDLGAYEFVDATGVVNPNPERRLNLYPNPVQSVLHIDTKGITKAEIFTLNGIKIQTIKNPQDGIDASGLTQGMYLIHIYTENGTVKKSFIKL